MKSEHELLLADYRESASRFPAILKLFTFVSGNIPEASLVSTRLDDISRDLKSCNVTLERPRWSRLASTSYDGTNKEGPRWAAVLMGAQATSGAAF